MTTPNALIVILSKGRRGPPANGDDKEPSGFLKWGGLGMLGARGEGRKADVQVVSWQPDPEHGLGDLAT